MVISQRMGDELDDLDMTQLRELEEDLETCLESIRERKVSFLETLNQKNTLENPSHIPSLSCKIC